MGGCYNHGKGGPEPPPLVMTTLETIYIRIYDHKPRKFKHIGCIDTRWELCKTMEQRVAACLRKSALGLVTPFDNKTVRFLSHTLAR